MDTGFFQTCRISRRKILQKLAESRPGRYLQRHRIGWEKSTSLRLTEFDRTSTHCFIAPREHLSWPIYFSHFVKTSKVGNVSLCAISCACPGCLALALSFVVSCFAIRKHSKTRSVRCSPWILSDSWSRTPNRSRKMQSKLLRKL